MNELVFRSNDGKAVTSSLKVAEVFKKEHKRVLQDIRDLQCSESFRLHNFVPSYYLNSQNKEMPMYILSKDGFTLLAMGYTGEKAMKFKEEYIMAFNEMDSIIKSQFKVPTTFSEALRLAAEQQEKIELQEKIIEEQKPKAEFYDEVMDSKTTIDMQAVAKTLNMGMGRTKLFDFLRNKKVLMQNNIPYQYYVDLGWFRVVESKYTRPNGDVHINLKTVVFQKGVDGIRKLLKGICDE